MSAYEHVLTLKPHAGSTYDRIGHIHYRTGSLEAAIEAYEKGIAVDPHYTGNYYGLSLVFAAKLGDYNRAIDAVERGLAANPGDPFLKATLGATYARNGEIEKGIQIKDNEYGQACFHAVSGNVEEALTLLESGIAKGQVQPGWARIDPEFAFIQDEKRFQALLR